MSFRDLVMGNKEAETPRQKASVDLVKEKLATIMYEDDNPLKPIVYIADSVFDGLCAPWQDALCDQAVGQKFGLQYHEGQTYAGVETGGGIRAHGHRK